MGVKSASDPAELFNLGNGFLERGDSEAAISMFRQCLEALPEHGSTWYNLGNALLAAGRAVEAVDAFVTCLRVAPELVATYLNLASTLRGLAMLEQARVMAELAVQHLPDEPEAEICLAAVLHDQTDHAAAVKLYRQVLARNPLHAGALSSLGNSLRALGHMPEALAAHDRAVAAAPGEPEFLFNRSTALLMAGDFANGWDGYEWRWQSPPGRARDLGSLWHGEDITGRTILLHAEQGLGDTLQFIRYVPLVAGRGAKVVLEVQPPLVRLVQALPGAHQVMARGDSLPPYDVHCPLLSLPRAFATRLETIPDHLPYLHADTDAVAAWRAKLPDDQRLRVGIAWAGSPHLNDAAAHLIDLRRSISLAELAPLGDIAGIHLVSLQKDRPDGANWALPKMHLIDLMPDVADFADTAALVSNLDLVISVDTSVAHLAAGLGRPVWLLTRYNGCWRWMHDRFDSPWYPGMRIFRQQRSMDWSGVIQHVRADLEGLVKDASGYRMNGQGLSGL